MKRTHWKLTARLVQVMVKEFENPIRQAGLLLLDMARSPQDSRRQAPCMDLGDRFTDTAAYLTRLLLANGHVLRLVNYQQDGRHELHADTPADLRQVQLMLAGMGFCENWPVENALIEETAPDKSACFIILVSTRLNKATVSQLLDLRQRGRPVWLVLLDGLPGASPEQQEAIRLMSANRLPMTGLDGHSVREEEAAG
jgi:uncharacterized protein (DUF58 family)